MLLAIDNRTAARSILARAATAKTPGPLKRSCGLLAALCGNSAAAAANAARIASIALLCASLSDPFAAVCATASARLPSLETQTPSWLSGVGEGAHRALVFTNSPLGRRVILA